MKKIAYVLSVLAISSLAVGAQAQDQTTDTAGANVTAEVIEPITITKNADLAFGRFSAAGAGTVVIPSDGTGRTAGGSVLLPAGINGSARAQFTVTGDAAATYSITLPGNGAILLASGLNSMSLSAFESTSTGTLTGGDEVVYVGATLNVADGQAPGTYSGTFDVTVDYN